MKMSVCLNRNQYLMLVLSVLFLVSLVPFWLGLYGKTVDTNGLTYVVWGVEAVMVPFFCWLFFTVVLLFSLKKGGQNV